MVTGWFVLSDRITAACDQHPAIETEIFFSNILPSDSGGKCALPIIYWQMPGKSSLPSQSLSEISLVELIQIIEYYYMQLV